MSDKMAYFMALAIEYAKLGGCHVAPNPKVGAVVVKSDKLIAAGYHAEYGGAHAEVSALKNCNEDLSEATLYVTLEPCCHYGKTPPCTEAIISSGIRKVVVGCVDPNPKVSGKGIERLRENGIEVIQGVMEEECEALNPYFMHRFRTGLPFVAMKYAMSIDGKIATRTGASKWISGEHSRERVHQMRGLFQGILVGVGTVLKDDPMLDCRIPEGTNPTRIILDTALEIPEDSRVVQTANQIPTIIVCGHRREEVDAHEKEIGTHEKVKRLSDRGCTVLTLEGNDGHPSLRHSLLKLAELGIHSLMVEGGCGVNTKFFEEGLFDELHVFIGPKLLGGMGAIMPFAGHGIEIPAESVALKLCEAEVLGEDIYSRYEVKRGHKCLQG